MKRILIILVLLLAACTQKPCIQSGDLLFVGLPFDYKADTNSMSSAIAEATGAEEGLNYIHTAILEVEGDSVWIIDATIKRGVARYPLDTFLVDFTLSDGSYPVFEIMRFKDGARDIVSKSKEFLGLPYDVYFLPDNGAMYCTELVRDSYLDENGQPLLPAAPMNFKAPSGEFPPYWTWLFDSIGAPIPQGVPGTNPQDMRNSPLLELINIPFPCQE